MLEVRNPVTVWGDAHIAHVAADLVQHMANWILEPVLASYLADDGELSKAAQQKKQ